MTQKDTSELTRVIDVTPPERGYPERKHRKPGHAAWFVPVPRGGKRKKK